MPRKTGDKKNRATVSPAYRELLKSIGEFMRYWGFKSVHGQVWACTFLAPAPVDSIYLIRTLKLSKAAVSLALKDLLQYDVLLEVPKERPSTQKYISNPDLVTVIRNVIRQREQIMLQQIVECLQDLREDSLEAPESAPVSAQQLEKLHTMSQQASWVAEQMLTAEAIDLAPVFAALADHTK